MAPQVRLAMNGASWAICGSVDDEPTCMHTTISRSLAAAHDRAPSSRRRRGSSGRPRGSGFSEKAKAVTPLAAIRSISLAASGGSHIGISISGM